MPKILLIPDFPHWALDKNARDLQKYNNSDIQFDIVYIDEFITNWQKYYSEYDLLFPMYIGLFKTVLAHKVPTDKLITGIRSFHRWDKKRTQPPGYNAKPSAQIVRMLRKALLVNTHCQKLWYIFSHYFPVVHTKYTCDLQMFYPEQKTTHEKLIVGWTGSLKNHGNKRGFYEFIKPICDEIDGIELKVQAKEDNFITDDHQMRAFYNSLDLYICASRAEGTPRPVIEAAACGIPSISTDVGIVPELIRNDENGFIVARDYTSIKTKLQQIVQERERLALMGEKIRQRMETEFNWQFLIYQWLDFFNYALELQKLKKQGAIR